MNRHLNLTASSVCKIVMNLLHSVGHPASPHTYIRAQDPSQDTVSAPRDSTVIPTNPISCIDIPAKTNERTNKQAKKKNGLRNKFIYLYCSVINEAQRAD